MNARAKPWYAAYGPLSEELEAIRQAFSDRCKELSKDPAEILSASSRDIIARVVFESNWQEGIQLDQGKTKELADLVFEDFDKLSTPHVDFAAVLNHHRKQVIRLKRKRATMDELAAYNLSGTHHALGWIANELMNRECASLAVGIRKFEVDYKNHKDKIPAAGQKAIEEGFALVKRLSENSTHPISPFTGGYSTEGEIFLNYLNSEFDNLLHPLRVSHIHFLHRLLMMGIMPAHKCGVFRKKGVHVSNPDVFFPPAEAITSLMAEFCHDFPHLANPNQDRVLNAAKVSFRFVRMHPYADGNGRVSRLLMNLVLFGKYPPVYLKADKKGRHRYSQALRRADRGNIYPLASLIALSLIDVYKKILSSISSNPGPTFLAERSTHRE